MDIKELIEKGRILLSSNFTAAELKALSDQKVKLDEMGGNPTPPAEPAKTTPGIKGIKTKDGLEFFIKGETPIKEVLVFSDGAGTVPMPDGDYILEDGSTISVAAGVITGVAIPEVIPPVDMSKLVQQMETKFSAVETNYKAIADVQDKKINELVAAVKLSTDTLNKILTTTVNVVDLKQTQGTDKSFPVKLSQEDYDKLSNKDKAFHNSIHGRP